MGGKSAALLLALAVASVSGSACAMSAHSAGAARCHVVDAHKLPGESGGEDALCRSIREAVAAEGIETAYVVEVRVLSASMIGAVTTTADGRALAEQKLATSDRPLTRASFERFARVLAAQLAEASRGR